MIAKPPGAALIAALAVLALAFTSPVLAQDESEKPDTGTDTEQAPPPPEPEC